MMRFDRFTERAQEAAQRAAEIIQRYGHNQIDTEPRKALPSAVARS
jgi:ATP-dependent Clp protease ATP-binding subunit ClpC